MSDPSASTVKLDLALEQSAYSPGNVLRGFVQAEVAPGLDAANVTIQLRGISCVKLPEGTQRVYDLFEPVESSSDIEGKDLRPGRYQFLFQLELPTDVPPTLFFKDVSDQGMESKSEVEYFIEVVLTPKDPSVGKIEKRFPVLVRTVQPSTQLTKTIQLDDVVKLHGCLCCFTGTQTSVRVKADAGMVKLGDSIKVAYNIDNAGFRPINCLEAFILEQVHFNAAEKWHKSEHVLSRVVEPVFIGPRSELQGEIKLNAEFSSASAKVQLETGAKPIFEIKHLLVFKAFYDGGFSFMTINIKKEMTTFGNGMLAATPPQLPKYLAYVPDAEFVKRAENLKVAEKRKSLIKSTVEPEPEKVPAITA